MAKKSETPSDSTPSPIGEISQAPSAFENFLDANQKKLVIVGILVILGIIGYVIYDGLSLMKQKSAAADFAAANTIPQLEAVAKKHQGTPAGGSALIEKARLLWRDQQQQEAVEELQSFLNSSPDHPAHTSALARLGSYFEQMGQLDKAKEALESAAAKKEAASSLALLSLGDIARTAGDDEAARAYYERISAEFGETHFQVKSVAEQRLKLIGVALPIEKAPAPPAPTDATTFPKPIIPQETTNSIVIPADETSPVELPPLDSTPAEETSPVELPPLDTDSDTTPAPEPDPTTDDENN